MYRKYYMIEREKDLLAQKNYTWFTIHQHPRLWDLISGVIMGDSPSAKEHKFKYEFKSQIKNNK